MVQKKNNRTTKKTNSASKTTKSRKPKSKTTSNKYHSQKKDKKQKENKNYIIHSIIVAIAIILITLALKGVFNNGPNNDIVAKVGDLEITSNELDSLYNNLPAEYKSIITKEQYLSDLLIPQKIILNEAKEINSSAVNEAYQKIIIESGQTEEEIKAQLAENGVSENEFMDSIKIKIYLDKVLAEKISVSKDELMKFYEANKKTILDENNETIPFENIKEDLESYLKNQKLQEQTAIYVEELKKQTEIKIFSQNINIDNNTNKTNSPTKTKISKYSFDATNDELCTTEDGKPIIRMFSTTWCPHCKWITTSFEKAIAPFVESGQIVAYHWELDVNDNTLTPEVETEIPEEELAIYQKYNPKGSIPTFVFGCKYARIGNGYEGEDGGEDKEFSEFTQIIEELVGSQ